MSIYQQFNNPSLSREEKINVLLQENNLSILLELYDAVGGENEELVVQRIVSVFPQAAHQETQKFIMTLENLHGIDSAVYANLYQAILEPA